ncbi:DUF192 domain-containing protein [Patescibacteria group bacterium]|nr:DUF192 domain-containing protein [Patescibacteria group bacterium]MCG2687949.1 DUF192 domain-containing protein [Candidatus Parcubacteria bacterium]
MSKQMITILILSIVVIIATIVILGLSPFSKGEWEGVSERAQISINDQVLDVYISKTEIDRMQGLSDISLEELDADGMLFLFDDSQDRVFWMKDMNFSLDIIWIDQGSVVKIEIDIQKFDQRGDITRMHSDPYAVDKVLELPAGGVDKYHIEVGQRVY